MAIINAYLNFRGNTEEAFNFYKSVFGGDFITLQRFKDTPGHETMPAEDGDKIMHVSLPVGNGNMLMGTDAIGSRGRDLNMGNNFSISISAESEKEADDLFIGLSAGGEVTMPLQKTFWNAYFGMFNDQFGIHWMVDYEYK